MALAQHDNNDKFYKNHKGFVMQPKNHLSSAISNTLPVALYSSAQLYAIEQDWFAEGYDSFALMQQAAWQMTQRIIELHYQTQSYKLSTIAKHALIWVGQGNNGGDGWLIALYLQQIGWQVKVITVDTDTVENSASSERVNDNAQALEPEQLSDALKAQRKALAANISFVRFKESDFDKNNLLSADVYIDAIFGIGLDRAPSASYEQAINRFNILSKQTTALVVSVDIPSGLVASTGEVFEDCAIKADITLCLIARKLGLHTKDGMDYAGTVFDVPLIPIGQTYSSETNNSNDTIKSTLPAATLLKSAYALPPRQQNSHKGSYGHVLIIGGNRIDGSQGMGGAAILAASSAMATGAGKITVACHDAFHGALLTSLPDAMTIDLHDMKGVKDLIQDASVVAIGMGLGRDKKAEKFFIDYVETTILAEKSLIIDADGLYHLASLHQEEHELVMKLKDHSKNNKVYLTPHSGEAARLLNTKIEEVEGNRLAAIKQCADNYGGNWVLKGAGSLVLEQSLESINREQQIYICAVGNAGMATAGMGDILSGVCAGLLAQLDLTVKQRSLTQAVLVHGLAGDIMVSQNTVSSFFDNQKPMTIGQRGLQAQDMPTAVRHVMQSLIV